MKTSTYLLGLIAIFIPVVCHADGLFYWSSQSSGGQPGDIVDHLNNYHTLEPFTMYLYYMPGEQDIGDGFSLDLKFEYYEVLDAEVYNFPITVNGTPVGERWDKFGDISIEGDSLYGFSALNLSGFAGGLRVDFTGSGVFLDQGYDQNAGAFLIGSVTLQGVYALVDYLSVVATNDGVDVFPDAEQNQLNGGCFLDPPYGGFDNSYQLPAVSGIAHGLAHCTSEPFDVCDGTVWYRIEPVADGLFTCSTFGSAVNTQLEVYTGDSVDELQLIAFVDDVAGTTRSRIAFPMDAGVRYSVRILSNPVEFAPTRMEYELMEGAVMGDVNGDNEVNLLDVVPFVGLVTDGQYEPTADVNSDGDVNLLDVAPFVDLLTQS